MASRALEVKSEYFDAQVVLVETGLFTHVKLCTDVEKVAAGIASNTHGQHHPDVVLLVSRPNDFLELGVIKIRRVILVEHLTL
jgi:hypothetical protein